MKFVILHVGIIPGTGNAKGPVLSPQEYDLRDVLKWIAHGIDIREVMEDGSYRKLEFNDRRINEAINKGLNKVNNQEPKLVDINDILDIKTPPEPIYKDEPVEEEILIEPIVILDPEPMKHFEEELEEELDEGFEIDELEESD